MEHIVFSNELKKIAPSPEAYLKLGHDEAFAQRMVDGYFVKERSSNVAAVYTDPIKNLVTTFDCTTVEIGMVTFSDGLEERGDYTLFGQFEADDLVISEITMEVIVLEMGIEHILWHCAANSACFLQALLIMAAFLRERGISDTLYDDEPANLLVAENCANVAGGEKYLDFYRMMLGF